MPNVKVGFGAMIALLRLRADDQSVVNLIEIAPEQIARVEYRGYVALKANGVSVVFAEAPWVIAPVSSSDEHVLCVSAFQLHAEGHEGYSQYVGDLPRGVLFGMLEAEIVQKMGTPVASGGGGMSRALGRPIGRWLLFGIAEGVTLQFQLSAAGAMEMATLAAPEIRHRLG